MTAAPEALADRSPGPWPPDPDWPWLEAAVPDPERLALDVTLAQLAAAAAGRLVYLASPYSARARDEWGGWCRLRSGRAVAHAAFWASTLAAHGVTAVSPVVQAGAMRVADPGGPDPVDADFWAGWCEPLLRAAHLVAVPPVLGWRASTGLWREVAWAVRAGRPVATITPHSLVSPLERPRGAFQAAP